VHRHGHAHAGPGQVLLFQHLAVGGLRLDITAQAVEQVGLQVAGVVLVLGVLLDDVVAGGDGVLVAAALDVAVGLVEDELLVQGPGQALLQLLAGEGLDQVVVRRQLGHRHHVLVGPLPGHHHEQGGQGNEALVAQLFQQLLAVAAVLQLVVGEDDVVAAALHQAQHLGGRADPLDAGDADGGQHHAHGVAGVRVAVHHQHLLVLQFALEFVELLGGEFVGVHGCAWH